MAGIIIHGVGKDAEVVTNTAGGKQSKAPMAMHLIDPEFLRDWFSDSEEVVVENIASFMQFRDRDYLILAINECYILLTNSAINEDGAIVEIAKVLQEGAEKYEANNWRLIPQEEHINHALIHYVAYRLGDTQDNHLEHCMTRLMMAYATSPSDDFDYTFYIKKTS